MSVAAAPAQPGRKKTLAACVGAACAALLMAVVPMFEGTVLTTYADPALGWAVPTACVGYTGPQAVRGRVFTPAECQALLAEDLVAHAQGVLACVTVPLSTGETAAYTSFAFNVGVRAFCTSTAARLLNSGDRQGACAQLSRWTRAGGRVLPGLVKRRATERALCEGRTA